MAARDPSHNMSKLKVLVSPGGRETSGGSPSYTNDMVIVDTENDKRVSTYKPINWPI